MRLLAIALTESDRRGVFVPNSAVETLVEEVSASLTLANTGQGPILLYPVKTKRFQQPLFRVPNEKVMFLFSILRTAVQPDSSTVTKMVNDNRKIFEQNRDLGGYIYPISSVPFSGDDWKQHFGSCWEKLVQNAVTILITC
jgi:hypothetical protein